LGVNKAYKAQHTKEVKRQVEREKSISHKTGENQSFAPIKSSF
jgi:hypothetical protein